MSDSPMAEFEAFRKAILAEGWLPPAQAVKLRAAAERHYDAARNFERKCTDAEAQLHALQASTANLRTALEQSVGLQSHYARLLNDHDGGHRRTFSYADWIERIAELEVSLAQSQSLTHRPHP